MKEVGKQIFVGVVTLLIVMIIFYGFFVPENNSIKKSISGGWEKLTSFKPTSAEDDNYCQNNIRMDNITFIVEKSKWVKNETIYSFSNIVSTWGDGTSIGSPSGITAADSYGPIYCRKGSGQGENVNYYYCDDIKYSNKEISSDGTIGEKRSYSINIVMGNPVKIGDAKIMYREDPIITYEIIDFKCKKI